MDRQLSLFCQRWREHRSLYVPPHTVIDPRRYDVEVIASDNDARSFLAEHHYLGSSYPNAILRYGLYCDGVPVGVVVLGEPGTKTQTISFRTLFRGAPVLVWQRLVLLDQVPANGESWFSAECLRRARREGVAGVVTFADPDLGHIGGVYQALSMAYLGRTRWERERVWRDGAGVFNRRSIAKIRSGDRGWKGAARRLVSRGADDPPHSSAERVVWLDTWLDRLTIAEWRPPKFRYAVGLDRFARRALKKASCLPYPKLVAGNR